MKDERTIGSSPFRAGFVSVVGAPNVGKSTLVNALVGEELCAVTRKIQTTRHEIMGVFTTSTFQMIFSDTPGWLNPRYALQASMLKTAKKVLQNADVILVVTDVSRPDGKTEALTKQVMERVCLLPCPTLHVVNKMDALESLPPNEQEDMMQAHEKKWGSHLPGVPRMRISALKKKHLDTLLVTILPHLPPHPPYFPLGQLSNREDRFFVAEHVVKAIFLNFRREIPYSVCTKVEHFEEREEGIEIAATIYTERESQKGILLGKGGRAIKRIRLCAQKDMVRFLKKRVHLRLQVSVLKDWRKDASKLKALGFFT